MCLLSTRTHFLQKADGAHCSEIEHRLQTLSPSLSMLTTKPSTCLNQFNVRLYLVPRLQQQSDFGVSIIHERNVSVLDNLRIQRRRVLFKMPRCLHEALHLAYSSNLIKCANSTDNTVARVRNPSMLQSGGITARVKLWCISPIQCVAFLLSAAAQSDSLSGRLDEAEAISI